MMEPKDSREKTREEVVLPETDIEGGLPHTEKPEEELKASAQASKNEAARTSGASAPIA
jgi:hypothetical protein